MQSNSIHDYNLDTIHIHLSKVLQHIHATHFGMATLPSEIKYIFSTKPRSIKSEKINLCMYILKTL